MSDCVFCKIVKGEISSYKIYEDDSFFAFLDISPRNLGHTLVIPKKHYRWVWDVENIGNYYEVVKDIANAIKRACNTDYIVSTVFGEDVPHAHVWLIPRYKNDGHGDAIDLENVKKFSESEMKNIAKEISQQIKIK
ncbi:hypothetical protein A2331_04375 [Candidatus Falkowbacteria bacterium RIFOXYB2_FULL_34_18]|uniref:HIT domain-containing protein n=1 Tax=Candidatus Falkowbacteria bacterium RIFOXYD2_FULL_34_120 TaxID=1798007 RepID=A0A1F5TMD1_9BACT|nr:MAG: hypothetical protein A2331_04375 [Candidatus Falkowbacteria bacterium RIFOXYB2_FULL_34_18]OGF30273.1 MAG: hypothetical protein A2500_06755 [Candidatus Falkowbacteria bacterium RIFOXYC12_FULL_34_55]OGF37824.1 MAG: hypothetical protein A2466_03880 [Candidatus Falkowbacteria bacterium RIFOXYC2_FULL_34_220]OGF39585.1 MAG: hypothetical protein A2515_03595 [Candidatus Falkowbacteria bacterium RIFOXYD12_FULL_34_57]OGF40009.1 MAG: hypothetical protein A2531_07325 [Candidatus Falkowbacteria bact